MSRRNDSKARLRLRKHALVPAVALAAVLSAGARAGELDPTLAHTFSLAEARVVSARSPLALPRNPTVKWRVRAAGGIAHPPVVAADGSVLLSLLTPTLVQYDARGRLSWSARLGASAAAVSTILQGNGTRLVLTQGAEALGFSARGQLLFQTLLPFASLDASSSVAPTDDGGILIASGRRLARLDAALNVVFTTRLEHDVHSILPGQPPLVVTNGGAVFELTPSGETLERGSFAAHVDAATRTGPRRVAAILEGRRLSELDVERETVTTRFSEPDLELGSTLASNPGSDLVVLGGGEFLIAFGPDGREKLRTPLPALDSSGRPPSSQLLLGPDRSVLVARAGLDVVAIQPDGSVARVEGSACADPLRPASVAPGSAIYACRSGIVLRLDDAASDRRP
ncbi:MAG TPA: PQQ-binding-like beta-propeller repeat protein [Polyangiaceae bacterium]|nr:PQQ-binding-like beta-propeller repeat protein [Polyangiaceae bacterium]